MDNELVCGIKYRGHYGMESECQISATFLLFEIWPMGLVAC